MRIRSLTALALVATGCPTTPDNQITDAIPVAVALPLTGAFADNGERHQAAVQMAIRDLQNAGGIKGKTLQPILVDCGDKMATAIERLDAELGPWNAPTKPVRAIISSSTACHEATLPYALQAKIPHLEVSSGSDTEEVSGYAVPPMANIDKSYELQVRGLCVYEAVMTPQFIADQPEMRKVAIIRGSHPHDVMHATTVRAEFPKTNFATLGGQILNAEDIVVPNDGPYEEGLNAALALNPDTIYFHLNGDTRNINFFSAMKRSAFQGEIVTCGMVRKPIVLDPVTPGFVDYLGGRLAFMMRGPVGSAQADAFKADYKAFFGKDADTFAGSGYDATMLLGLALAAETGSDGASLRDAIKAVASGGTAFSYGQTDKMLEAIKAGTDINYEGASGTLDFHPDNSVPSKYYVDDVVYDAAANKGSYVTRTNPVVVR